MILSKPLLGVLLIGQLVLTGVLFVQSKSNATVRPDSALLEFDIDSIDKLSIEDQENALELKRTGDDWQLAESGMSVNASRVATLLDSLAAARTGWAVATRDESHQQLLVADDKFNRKVSLFSNDKEVSKLFIGSSPGLRRSHARVAEMVEVYSVALNDYDIPANTAEWVEKDLLAIDAIEEFSFSDYTFNREGEDWQVKHSKGEIVTGDKTAIDDFARQLNNLRILDVAEQVPQDAERHVLQIISGDSQYTYELFSDDDNHYVTRNDMENNFTISQASYSGIVDADPADFLPVVEEAEPVKEKSEVDENLISKEEKAAD